MQQKIDLKIKRLHKDAILPKYAHDSDAGLDLVAVSKQIDETGLYTYGTGLAVEIPAGHVGLIFPRSSISRTNMVLTNCVGVIDSGYRGEITFKFTHYTKDTTFKCYEVGDKIGQLVIMPYPKINITETDYLSSSDRGEDGFGSTGN